MKKLKIEWKHFDKEGKTCNRCSKTGRNLISVLQELKGEFSVKGIHIEFQETKLPQSHMMESNSILINDTPLEDLIPDTEAGENICYSCSELIGKFINCRCRTIQHGEDTFEEVPSSLIKQAILKKLQLDGVVY